MNKALYLARYLNVEFKHYDSTISDTVLDTFQIKELAIPAEGDSTTTRDGNSIKVIGVEFSGTLTISSSATVSYVRLCIVRDDQTNGASPTGTELFTSTGDFLGQLNPNLPNRFVWYYDKLFCLSSSTNPGMAISYKKSLNFHIMFNNSTSSVASCPEKSLKLIYIGSEDTNYPLLETRNRVVYVDN
jgi:hypothetical protein